MLLNNMQNIFNNVKIINNYINLSYAIEYSRLFY